MVWQNIGTISPTKSWQFLSCPTSATFVRLTHSNLPFLPNGFLCQADALESNSGAAYEILNVTGGIGSNNYEIFSIDPYAFFTSRHLGFRQVNKLVNQWQILVEVSDAVSIYDLSPASLNLLLQSVGSLQQQISTLSQQIQQYGTGSTPTPTTAKTRRLPFPSLTGTFRDGIFYFTSSAKTVVPNFSLFKPGVFTKGLFLGIS